MNKEILIKEIKQAVKDVIEEFNLVYYRKPLSMDFIYENGRDKIADAVIKKVGLYDKKVKEIKK